MVHVKVLQLHSNHYHHDHDHHWIGITKTDRKALGIWWREDNLLSFLSFESGKSGKWERLIVSVLSSDDGCYEWNKTLHIYKHGYICNDNGDNIMITVVIWLWMPFVPLRFHFTTASHHVDQKILYTMSSHWLMERV